jgi:mannose-1-phosphate guanylyltransferase
MANPDETITRHDASIDRRKNMIDGIALDEQPPRELGQTMESGPASSGHQDLWAIVLAGGEGARLRPLVRQVFRNDRPKQYARLLGPQSLLAQTLERVGLQIPIQRTMVATMFQHAAYLAEEFTRRARPIVVTQPCDRGTVAGILYPAHRIAWEDPEATVAVFPSDHFVAEEATFMAHVAEVGQWIDRNPDRTVLLGAQPTAPEVEYGWIEPGEYLGEVGSGPIRTVREFWEKPSLSAAHACLGTGHLWNTSVIVAKVSTLLELGRARLPDVDDRLARIRKFAGTWDEAAAIYQAYELLPKANFSRAILEACPTRLAVSQLPQVGWSDLGSPRRVMEAVARLSPPPDWAKDFAQLA